MAQPVRIGFAGTDGRTLNTALMVSTAQSESQTRPCRGVVVRGTPAMPRIARELNWGVDFIPTRDNSVQAYARAARAAFDAGDLDYLVPMPESLLLNGIVDILAESGNAGQVAGLTRDAAFIEGDKIRCKAFCRRAGIPVADEWAVVDAKSFSQVAQVVLEFIHAHGGAVLKYPFSAGGKGARIILDTWDLRQVWDSLVRDYKQAYKKMFRNRAWPLLVESRMSGIEISFTILVDARGHFQILPSAMDYPLRFQGPATPQNPVTGGMGSISPHPFDSGLLTEMARELIAHPLVTTLREEGLLRPCILYPGCFVSLSQKPGERVRPSAIRVCEINIRPGEPEFQTVARRLKNPGPLFEAMFTGELDQVVPEVREDQISVTCALVTGPGGPDGQKGYPWRVTRNEPVEIDFPYLRKKGLHLMPSAMGWSEEKGLISDGTRVAYLIANGRIGSSPAETAQRLTHKMTTAWQNQKVRVVPREDSRGNRLDMRSDIGCHFGLAREILDPSQLKKEVAFEPRI